jgi:hypothetical protein
MKRAKLLTLVSVLLLVALAAVPAFAADPNPGKGSTDVTVMNTEGGSSSVTAEYYNQNGTLANQKSANLNALGAGVFKASDSGLPDNWRGSMIVSSTTDVAAVATLFWKQNPAGDGIEADSYSGFSTGADRMNIPFAVYAPNAQYTVLTVQNTGSAVASITMKYYNRDGALDFTITDSVPVNGQTTYDLHTPGPKVPVWSTSSFFTTNGVWTGAVVITTGAAGQTIAAVANNFWPKYSAAFNASTGNNVTKWFIPSVERRLLGTGATAPDQLGFSVITVQNAGTVATNLTFKFINAGTQTVDATITYNNLQPGAAIGCNTRIGAQCDAGLVATLGTAWAGSATVESSAAPITAMSFTLRPRDDEAVGTTAASAGNAGPSTYLASVHRVGSGDNFTLWSLLRIQNVTTSDANGVVVKFLNRDGTEVAAARQTINIGAGKSSNFNLRYTAALAVLGSDFNGTVQITSPQPLAAVVENLWNLSQMASYNGYSK